MKKLGKKRILLVVGIVSILAFSYYIYSMEENQPVPSIWEKGIGEIQESTFQSLTSENSTQFESKERGFSFLYPKNLKSSNIPNDSGEQVLVFQDAEKGQGFQIVISPFDEDISVLDEARIRMDLPDLKLENPEEVLLGNSGRGTAFLSDNESFAKNSREVWFVYKGYLYQISTYAHLDPLLQSVLATWEFK
jgi:hypothetical protein